MSIDMYLGSSDQQASSAQHVLQNHINAYQQLQTALSQFTVNSPSLSGVTYQSAKAYSSQVLTPLLRASILLDEAIIAACRKLPSEYRSSVDSVDLRESDLVDRIARADRIVGRYQELINIEYQRTKPNWSRIQNLQTARSNQLTVKRKLEEKLHKLRAFHQSSPQFFSQIAGLHSAVQQGIRQSQQSWNASTKTFVLPPKSEMKWAEEVNGKWEKSPTYMQELIHKSQKGFSLSDQDVSLIQQYKNKYPQAQIPEHLQSAINIYREDKKNRMTTSAKIEDATEGVIIDATLGGLSHAITRDGGWASRLGYSLGTMFDETVSPLAATANNVIRAGYTGVFNSVGNAIGSTAFGATVGSVIGMMQGESPGQAIASSVMTTTVSTIVATGATQILTGLGVIAAGATPVGWAIGIGVGAGFIASYLYNSNFMGMKSTAQSIGKNIDQTLSNIGKTFSNVGDFLWGN